MRLRIIFLCMIAGLLGPRIASEVALAGDPPLPEPPGPRAEPRIALGSPDGLPTEGIDEPVPGVLALPATLPGPFGVELKRSLGPVGYEEATGLPSIAYRYTVADPRSKPDPFAWTVSVTVFASKGQAHTALHQRLAPVTSSGERLQFERLRLTGLFFGPPTVADKWASYSLFGVVRQAWIQIELRPEQNPLDLDSWRRSALPEAMNALVRLVDALRDAPRIEPVPSKSVAKIIAKRSDGMPSGRQAHRLELTVLPAEGSKLPKGQEVWVVVGRQVFLRHGTRSTIRLPESAWSGRESVRLFFVHEEGPLRIEVAGPLRLAPDEASEWTRAAAVQESSPPR